MEKFEQSEYTLELSKGPKNLRNRVELMAWSEHVTTDESAVIKSSQFTNQKARPYNILFSHFLEYSQMSQIQWGHGHCLHITFVMT